MKGVTLIETIIVITILAVTSMIMSVTFITLWRVSQMNLSSFETKSQGGITMQKIADTIEASSSVLSSRAINGAAYTTNESSLVLQIPSINSSSEIVAAAFDYAAFAASSTEIFMDIEPSASSVRPGGKFVLANLAKDINFRYNSSTSTDITTIEIFIHTAKSSYGLDQISTLSTVAQLKNK